MRSRQVALTGNTQGQTRHAEQTREGMADPQLVPHDLSFLRPLQHTYRGQGRFHLCLYDLTQGLAPNSN